MPIRITCINKSGGDHADPHHAISYLGWVEDGSGKTEKSSRVQIYEWIKYHSGSAYVADSRGNKVWVRTRENQNGTRFLQTYADGKWTDNLLALPECR